MNFYGPVNLLFAELFEKFYDFILFILYKHGAFSYDQKVMENKDLQKKVSFYTLGCRLNFSESGSLKEGFQKRGYQIVPFEEPADVVFLNTCTVTDGADSTCRHIIRKANRISPEATLVVAGCYAQMESELLRKMQGVDLILGTSEKYNVFNYLEEFETQQQTLTKIEKSLSFSDAGTTQSDASHTRGFLKIQDGCNYVCSFCIIPYARGRSRAITIREAKKNALEMVKSGFKEIVLTGVNIGEYENVHQEKFSDLVGELLNIEGLERFRLSSIEPNTITDDLISVLKESPKVMDHFHVPLQSGDDKILQLMKRKYNIQEYAEKLSKIKKVFPQASIGADVLTGFPSEEESHFQNTYDFLEQSSITHFHVFPYSKRKGTPAAKMLEQIPLQEKKRRVETLIKLGKKKLRDFSLKQIGQEQEVLFERRDKEGFYTGYTPQFLKVKVKTSKELHNHIKKVKIFDWAQESLLGELT